MEQLEIEDSLINNEKNNKKKLIILISAIIGIILLITIILIIILSTKETKNNDNDDNYNYNYIIYPTNNLILPAGIISITWNAPNNTIEKDVEKYVIIIDNSIVGETKEKFYNYYSVNVKYHKLKIQLKYLNGKTISLNTNEIKFGISKKGLAVNEEMGKNLNLTNLNISWYYNWNYKPNTGNQYSNIQYIPMLWGERSSNDAKTKINSLINEKYNYLLTYNEPDRQDQCNMSVEEVYEIFKNAFQNYSQIKISSPVTSIWPKGSDWFQNFTKLDIDYDFISIHCYANNFGGKGMSDWFLKDIIDYTWDTYKKPIWVTEFTTIGDKGIITEENSIEFWKNVMPELDKRDYVIRYAAFGFNGQDYSLWNYDNGNITKVGEVYGEYGNPVE